MLFQHRRVSIFLAVLCTVFSVMPLAGAHRKAAVPVGPDKIIYVPHDNRPISDKQTAAVVRKLGYDVVVPPDELLGSRNDERDTCD